MHAGQTTSSTPTTVGDLPVGPAQVLSEHIAPSLRSSCSAASTDDVKAASATVAYKCGPDIGFYYDQSTKMVGSLYVRTYPGDCSRDPGDHYVAQRVPINGHTALVICSNSTSIGPYHYPSIVWTYEGDPYFGWYITGTATDWQTTYANWSKLNSALQP